MKNGIICRKLLTYNEMSRILNLDYESNEKTNKLIFSGKLHSILESEDSVDATAQSNSEHIISSYL